MITLGVSPRRNSAIGLNVIEALSGRGPVKVTQEHTGCLIEARDGSNLSAWIPKWKDQTDFPAETRLQVVEWLKANHIEVEARVRARS